MNVRTELYNLDSDGSKNYLSDGQSRLIPLFFECSLAFFFLLVLWAYYCYCNKRSMNRVHLLITGLITMKTLSLIRAALDKYFVKLTGIPHGWEIMFEVAQGLTSLIVTACGSSIIGFSFFLNPFLREKKTKLFNVAIALQDLPNVAFPFARTMGDTWLEVAMVLGLLHVICACTILVITGRPHWLLQKAAKTD
ncbi:protein CANDIDATE G-PROTEIN COUPLED RECEPTOR 7-like [Eucalyptus grandis]|uniref:protein CANDIDATE G-PROTEIN COUPLED RECEPTOR 7-like n=1 Tax=Eucalyptus grandis TaxID=71139 RepID=UPI00192E99DD|nr:protein CANDIDATE G-PROTEIN COUPLED RECEPTOR 7-like [Eucalyptus grandis]